MAKKPPLKLPAAHLITFVPPEVLADIARSDAQIAAGQFTAVKSVDDLVTLIEEIDNPQPS